MLHHIAGLFQAVILYYVSVSFQNKSSIYHIYPWYIQVVTIWAFSTETDIVQIVIYNNSILHTNT
jgi:hypothetical protein